MANCNELFSLYNSAIKLSEERRTILRAVRNSLRKKIERKFNELIFDETLEFHSQGSYVMDTIITPKDDDYDLDYGVYFLGDKSKEDRPDAKEFHDAILFAVGEDESYADVTDKDTCVRVRYDKEKFHIDLPIYYADSPTNPNLAHLSKDWPLSNPVEFIAWFEEKVASGFQKAFLYERRMFSEYKQWQSDIRKEDAQLRRIVRYLKGWSDELRGEVHTSGSIYRPFKPYSTVGCYC
ncbi:CBASS cGAMP synthase [Sphingobacterium hungaricum]|nr:hypothetical protein [Sphingobacterium hungaricum]